RDAARVLGTRRARAPAACPAVSAAAGGVRAERDLRRQRRAPPSRKDPDRGRRRDRRRLRARRQGGRQPGDPDRLPRLHRPEHPARLQGRRHRPGGRGQHLLQLRGLLGVVGAHRRRDLAGRLLLRRGRRARLRSRRRPGRPAAAAVQGDRDRPGRVAGRRGDRPGRRERGRARGDRRPCGGGERRPAVRGRRGGAGAGPPGPADGRGRARVSGGAHPAPPPGAAARAALAVLVSGGILVYLFTAHQVDPRGLLPLVRAISLPGLLGYVLVSALGLVLRALRYRYLLDRPVPLWPLVLVTAVRNMAVDLLPGRVGAAASYLYLVRARLGLPLEAGVASFAVAFILDTLALAPLLVLALLLVGAAAPVAPAALVAGSLILLAGSVAALRALAPLLRLAGG